MANCTPRSLKLLEMPFLRKKLGFKGVLDDERVTANRDYGYTDKVLVGNWLERRWDDHQSRELDFTTQYRADYDKKTGVRDLNSVWANRLQNQGSVELKQTGNEDEGPSNMATVYDLAYRCRVRDFATADYGSVTNYGKRECKQGYWDSQTDDRDVRFHTEYRDQFSFTPCLAHLIE